MPGIGKCLYVTLMIVDGNNPFSDIWLLLMSWFLWFFIDWCIDMVVDVHEVMITYSIKYPIETRNHCIHT